MPTTVYTSNSPLAMAEPCTRKSFYAAGRWWLTWAEDAGQILYSTSTDAISWSSAGTIPTGGDNYGYDYGTHYDGSKFSYARTVGAVVYYRRGTPTAGGTFTWDAAEQTVRSGLPENGTFANILTDGSGYPWITYSIGQRYLYVIKSSTNNGTWTTQSGYPILLIDGGGSSKWPQATMVWLGGSNIYLNYGYIASTFRGKLYSGSWQSEEVLPGGASFSGIMSATAERPSANVYFVAKDNSSKTIYYYYRPWGGSWTSPNGIKSLSAFVPLGITLISTSDWYVFYGEGNYIKYQRCKNSVWQSEVTLYNESYAILWENALTILSASSQFGIMCHWIRNVSGSYQIRVGFLLLPIVCTGSLALSGAISFGRIYYGNESLILSGQFSRTTAFIRSFNEIFSLSPQFANTILIYLFGYSEDEWEIDG